MKVLYIAMLALVLGSAHAYQVLSPGFFLYDNVSVGSGGQIISALDANSTVSLIVIRSSDLPTFSSGYQVNELYSRDVGSGIYAIVAPPGNYSVIFEANNQTSLASGALACRAGAGQMVHMDGNYSYSFTTANYSNTNVTILSSADFASQPLFVDIAGAGFNLNQDSVVEFLNLSLSKGSHTVTLQSSGPEDLFILVSAQPALVNPLSELASGGNYATGVASYGLYNISGTLIPYQVSTSEVVGVANITSMESTSLQYRKYNVSQHAASLQLNVQLHTHYKGAGRTYWLQDVADFNQSANTMYFEDNIWNDTLPDANMTGATVSGGGNVTSCNGCNQTFYAYGYPYLGINYTMPLGIKLLVYENNTGSATSVSFGYQILGNGNQTVQPQVMYDTVTIPGAYNSTILVTPYYTTPSDSAVPGDSYDAELVFAGEANGAQARFTKIGATMWIYYLDNGSIVPFPSAYTFGLNTAENASGIRIVPGGYGARAVMGSPDYARDIIVSNASSVYASYIANTSRYTAPPTTVPQYIIPQSGSAIAEELQAAIPYALVLIIAGLVITLVRIAMERLFGRER